MHYRLNMLLVVVLVVCALLLVDAQHRARKLFIELERMQTRSRELDIQFKQLQLDQLRLAKASMIDQRARRDLGMTSASADRTMYLTMPPVVAQQPHSRLAMAAPAAVGVDTPTKVTPAAGGSPAASGASSAAGASPAESSAPTPRTGPAKAAGAAGEIAP